MNAQVQWFGNKNFKSILILVGIIFSIPVSSQEKKWDFNFNIGYSQATQSYDKFFQINPWKKNIHNLYVGLDVQYHLTPKWSILLSMLLIEHGYRNEYLLVFDDIDSTHQNIQHIKVHHKFYYSLNYLDIPILVEYKWKKAEFATGIYAGYTLGFTRYTYMHTEIYKSTGSLYSFNQSDLLYLGVSRGRPGEPFNLLGASYDFGVVLSIGYKITKDLSFKFTCLRGLKNSFNYKEGSYSYGLGYNVAFLFGLNYTLFKL